MRWSVLIAPLCWCCAAAGPGSPVPGGNPVRGAELLETYGCGACHVIPGVPGARGTVGPPLGDFRDRTFIAGRLPNVPDSLVRFLVAPQFYEPGGAMPALGVTEEDARHMAARLFSLP